MQIRREDILAMEPGTELDALIAEHIFGWWRLKSPSFDYDGPCESNDVLVPPTLLSKEEAFRCMPPKGVVPFTYFVNRNWSTRISAAWEVEEKIKTLRLHVEYSQALRQVVMSTGEYVGLFDYIHATPEQRCKAALLAVLEEEEAK